MKKLHQSQWLNILHRILIYKSYNKWRKRYTKPSHEIFYTKFLIRKVTPHPERITRKTKNFTPNLFFIFFFTKSERFYTKHQNFYTKLEKFYTKLMALLGFRTKTYVCQNISKGFCWTISETFCKYFWNTVPERILCHN